MTALYTAHYGQLIDDGIITAADLPPEWDNFPAVTLPDGSIKTFMSCFYDIYNGREIAADTVAEFLRFLKKRTVYVLENLPAGIYGHVLAEMAADAEIEKRTVDGYAAPNGAVLPDYSTGRSVEQIEKAGAASGDVDRAERIMRDGKPLAVWIAERYENCFMGVF